MPGNSLLIYDFQILIYVYSLECLRGASVDIHYNEKNVFINKFHSMETIVFEGLVAWITINAFTYYDQWRIIARWSSVFPGIVHADDFVWLMFVHERFSASEQTLNTQKHLSGLYKGKHEIKVQ